MCVDCAAVKNKARADLLIRSLILFQICFRDKCGIYNADLPPLPTVPTPETTTPTTTTTTDNTYYDDDDYSSN